MLAWLKGHFWLGSFGKLAAISVIAASFGTAGCGDDPVKAGVAKGCTLNSDCAGGLVCSADLCHQECEETKDCPAGQRCVQAKDANVCQLDNDAECVFNSDCAPPLVCADDLQCRNECKTAVDCLKGQECADGVCAEPAEVDDMGGLKGAVDMGGGGEGGGPGTVGPGPGGGGEGRRRLCAGRRALQDGHDHLRRRQRGLHGGRRSGRRHRMRHRRGLQRRRLRRLRAGR